MAFFTAASKSGFKIRRILVHISSVLRDGGFGDGVGGWLGGVAVDIGGSG